MSRQRVTKVTGSRVGWAVKFEAWQPKLEFSVGCGALISWYQFTGRGSGDMGQGPAATGKLERQDSPLVVFERGSQRPLQDSPIDVRGISQKKKVLVAGYPKNSRF